jgi:hypothetical protein
LRHGKCEFWYTHRLSSPISLYASDASGVFTIAQDQRCRSGGTSWALVSVPRVCLLLSILALKQGIASNAVPFCPPTPNSVPNAALNKTYPNGHFRSKLIEREIAKLVSSKRYYVTGRRIFVYPRMVMGLHPCEPRRLCAWGEKTPRKSH